MSLRDRSGEHTSQSGERRANESFRVSSIIAKFENDSDPKKNEAVPALRRILIKQRKKLQKEAAGDGMRMEQ